MVAGIGHRSFWRDVGHFHIQELFVKKTDRPVPLVRTQMEGQAVVEAMSGARGILQALQVLYVENFGDHSHIEQMDTFLNVENCESTE